MKIVFLDRNTLSPQTVLRPPKFTHQLETYEQSSPQEVKERIADADIVVVNKVKLTRDAIASAKKIKVSSGSSNRF